MKGPLNHEQQLKIWKPRNSASTHGSSDLSSLLNQLKEHMTRLTIRARDCEAAAAAAAVTPASIAPVSTSASSDITAPKMKPPTFSSKILDWPAFWNLRLKSLKDDLSSLNSAILYL